MPLLPFLHLAVDAAAVPAAAIAMSAVAAATTATSADAAVAAAVASTLLLLLQLLQQLQLLLLPFAPSTAAPYFYLCCCCCCSRFPSLSTAGHWATESTLLPTQSHTLGRGRSSAELLPPRCRIILACESPRQPGKWNQQSGRCSPSLTAAVLFRPSCDDVFPAP